MLGVGSVLSKDPIASLLTRQTPVDEVTQSIIAALWDAGRTDMTLHVGFIHESPAFETIRDSVVFSVSTNRPGHGASLAKTVDAILDASDRAEMGREVAKFLAERIGRLEGRSG